MPRPASVPAGTPVCVQTTCLTEYRHLKTLPSRRSVRERNRLVTENYGLIFWAYNWARARYPDLRRWFPDRSEEDWCQVLAQGLMRAAELYDEGYLVRGKPVKFGTYAGVTLARAVMRDVGKFMVRLARRGASIPFTDLLGSRAAGIDRSRLEERLGLFRDRPEPAHRNDEVDLVNGLAARLLRERDRDMLARRMAGETYLEIGKRHGASKERVRQLIERSLDTLRKACHAEKGGVA